ncbi:carbohydrate kinase family protein [Streptomyces atacamensis]|uniref:carbohydrate kinase family protein n=1 Tax=Streptomyces atacamensis TaxID=531966 RepID=UPI00399C8FD7
MRTAVTGSIATDHLLTFPGVFTDQLLAERLDRVSLSFLADRLEVRRGGVAANICYGLGLLGLRPVLVGAAGGDFEPYRLHLKEHGIDTDSVHISESLHTARFVCTTDRVQNQIATFYAGAMAEARTIDLRRVIARVGRLDLVVISPDDPEAMIRHTDTCRALNIPFAADPSQQLARLERDEVRRLLEGARWLFGNEYEAALLQERSGWSTPQILDRVGCWITTLGDAGVRLRRKGRPDIEIPAVPVEGVVDPTGVGDAFRAGFVAGMSWDLPGRVAAQFGCTVAATALDYIGTQEYRLYRESILSRMRTSYGTTAAAQVVPHLRELP